MVDIDGGCILANYVTDVLIRDFLRAVKSWHETYRGARLLSEPTADNEKVLLNTVTLISPTRTVDLLIGACRQTDAVDMPRTEAFCGGKFSILL